MDKLVGTVQDIPSPMRLHQPIRASGRSTFDLFPRNPWRHPRTAKDSAQDQLDTSPVRG
jgi:hypothetical protein